MEPRRPAGSRPSIVLRWERFSSLTAARAAFARRSCVYVQADRKGRAIRIGKAGSGLLRRYYGGTGYALDAAMHRSRNLVFAAPVRREIVDAVEATLIWRYRDVLLYNNLGKRRAPRPLYRVTHRGDPPQFT